MGPTSMVRSSEYNGALLFRHSAVVYRQFVLVVRCVAQRLPSLLPAGALSESSRGYLLVFENYGPRFLLRDLRFAQNRGRFCVGFHCRRARDCRSLSSRHMTANKKASESSYRSGRVGPS